MIVSGRRKAALLLEAVPPSDRKWILAQLGQEELSALAVERMQAHSILKQMKLGWQDIAALVGFDIKKPHSHDVVKQQAQILLSIDDAVIIQALNQMSSQAVWVLTHSSVLPLQPFYLAMLDETLVKEVAQISARSAEKPSHFVVQELVAHLLKVCGHGNT